MKVKELIAQLQQQDPEAHVIYWGDDGPVPVLAHGIRAEFVQIEPWSGIIAYHDELLPGYEPSVCID